MRPRIPPSIVALLDEANRRHPNRSKVSDGTVGDAAHRRRSSDHNPDDDGWVHAVDLTHDPDHGLDAHQWVRGVVARRDPRVAYVISQAKIASSSPVAGHRAWAWRPYSGANPHNQPAHVSIRHTDAARNDTSSWWSPVTVQEVRAMFENHRFAAATPGSFDHAGRLVFYSFDPDTSAVYAWNGAPGPVLSQEGQDKARAAGGIRTMFAFADRGWVAVVGNPGEHSTWSTWASWALGPGDRA